MGTETENGNKMGKNAFDDDFMKILMNADAPLE